MEPKNKNLEEIVLLVIYKHAHFQATEINRILKSDFQIDIKIATLLTVLDRASKKGYLRKVEKTKNRKVFVWEITREGLEFVKAYMADCQWFVQYYVYR